MLSEFYLIFSSQVKARIFTQILFSFLRMDSKHMGAKNIILSFYLM